jgi:hypothetical protein
MNKPEKPKVEKPRTREENLRDLILLHQFVILDKGNKIAEGYIVHILNVEVVMVDLWRNGDRETMTTHYLPLNQMTWNEFSQTGFRFKSGHDPQD